MASEVNKRGSEEHPHQVVMGENTHTMVAQLQEQVKQGGRNWYRWYGHTHKEAQNPHDVAHKRIPMKGVRSRLTRVKTFNFGARPNHHDVDRNTDVVMALHAAKVLIHVRKRKSKQQLREENTHQGCAAATRRAVNGKDSFWNRRLACRSRPPSLCV